MKEFIEIKGKIEQVTFVATLKKNCTIRMYYYEVEVNFNGDCEITEFKFNFYIDCIEVRTIGKKLTEEVIEACHEVGWPV